MTFKVTCPELLTSLPDPLQIFIYILSDDLLRRRSLPILKLQTSLQGVGNILKVLHHPFWKAIFLQTTSTFLLGDFAQLSVRDDPAQ